MKNREDAYICAVLKHAPGSSCLTESMLTLVSRQCAEHKEQDYQRYPKHLIQVYHSHDYLY